MKLIPYRLKGMNEECVLLQPARLADGGPPELDQKEIIKKGCVVYVLADVCPMADCWSSQK